ncbi:hypothetical protein [Parabacteroides goldsteinii]|uniref:hypothetical protein n=1 Tax=Parabacteroides goldsteinii TaxID=328812 RepID=UPI002432622D|nr:hypothetical protein [Parabacteroides goldsteinii]
MKTMTFRQPVLAATALLMPFTTFAQEGNKKKKSAFICAHLCHLRAMGYLAEAATQ